MSFADHFSGHADRYRQHRPTYPAELFEFLAAAAPTRQLAWDVGTGSGQAALDLARWFAAVIATDASSEQIAHAPRHPKVRFITAPAERSSLAAGSVDLVTVAQALHWFDRERFYAEVRRVARPGAILAVWCYELQQVSAEVDAVVEHFYRQVVGPYWPPERLLIEAGYQTIAFPFEGLPAPPFQMSASWSLSDVLGYLGTWSAVKRYREALGSDPLPALGQALRAVWGAAESRRPVRWPLRLRVGRITPA